jgi:hypothetical protein
MQKTVIFAFRGDPMCFIHVLLNALEMSDRGQEGRIVMEGEATKLVPELARPGHPLNAMYEKVKERGLIDGVCRACSAKTGVLDAVKQQGLPLVSEMSGHPSMGRYVAEGYQIITL